MPRPSAHKSSANAPRRRASVLTVDGAVWLRQGGQALGGADRVALLEAIRDTGSMTRAAVAVGISYKTAWERVLSLDNAALQPLVERAVGGAGGGGTRLTPYAHGLIAAFRELERSHAQMVQRLSASIARPDEALRSLAALGLRTSARNQLLGTVQRVGRGAVNAIVTLALPGGTDTIQASVTTASVRELRLKRGVAAVALIKAPSIGVVTGATSGTSVTGVTGGTGVTNALGVTDATNATGEAPHAGVPGNVLAASITRLVPGAANIEVQARLAGGQTMTALLSSATAARLGLARGMPVRFVFPEGSVILGVI